MSIRELMKKGKIIEDNVIMIGVNCGGTLPPVPTMQMIRDVYELDPSDVIKEEIAKGKLIMETAEGEKGFGIEDLEEDGMGRRENCQRCDLKIPSNADLALGNWGVIGPLAGKATFVEYNEAKLNLTKALSDKLQAKYEYLFRTKILDFYKGQTIE